MVQCQEYLGHGERYNIHLIFTARRGLLRNDAKTPKYQNPKALCASAGSPGSAAAPARGLKLRQLLCDRQLKPLQSQTHFAISPKPTTTTNATCIKAESVHLQEVPYPLESRCMRHAAARAAPALPERRQQRKSAWRGRAGVFGGAHAAVPLRAMPCISWTLSLGAPVTGPQPAFAPHSAPLTRSRGRG